MAFIVGTNREGLWELLPQGGMVAEVGVDQGEHAAILLEKMKPKRLVLVDAWQHLEDPDYEYDGANVDDATHQTHFDQVSAKFSSQVQTGQVEIRRMLSNTAAASYLDGHFDIVYIDGNHTYEACLKDLLCWAPKVHRHGLLSGHDFSNSVHAINHRFGVVAAVQEFCRRTGWEVICISSEPHASYVLARPDSKVGAYLAQNISKWEGIKIELASIFPFSQGEAIIDEKNSMIYPRIGF